MLDCIAAWGRLKSVLQYNYCIAGKSMQGIVLQESVLQYTGLYCRLGGVVLQRRRLFVSQYKRTVL